MLNTESNITEPDDFYQELIDLHRDLSEEQSALVGHGHLPPIPDWLIIAGLAPRPPLTYAGDGRPRQGRQWGDPDEPHDRVRVALHI